jgi:hypothetical protein
MLEVRFMLLNKKYGMENMFDYIRLN